VSARAGIAAGVVAFWLLMMGWMAQREFGVQRLSAETLSAQPQSTFFALLLPSGEQAGYVHAASAPEGRFESEGVEMTLSARGRLTFLGNNTDFHLQGSAWRALGPPPPDAEQQDRPDAEFDWSLTSGNHDIALTGQIRSGLLSAKLQTAGETIPFSLPMDADIMMSTDMLPILNTASLEPGDSFVLDTFDPMSLSTSEARVECIGRETITINGESLETTKLAIEGGGYTSMAWVDANDEIARIQMPFGFTLERASPDTAIAGTWAKGNKGEQAEAARDFVQMASIVPEGLTPVRRATRMRVKLSGLQESLAIPEDAAQRFLPDGTLLVQQPAPDVEWRPAAAGAAQELQPYLAGDLMVQSTHSKIQGRAQAIADESQSVWAKAHAIHGWVFENIEKKAVLSFPSALEVLEQREGDCNEHTVLFAALARAAGVPTRIAVGIVWSEEYQGFYYHAWPEVYAGRWVWMDPTLGQPVADATHIKLLTGGIEAWPRLVGFLGALEVEVLEVS